MRRRIILEGNKTEKVTINVSTSNGASASGITVTINGSATTTNADGVAYGEVPFDTSYSIVFGTKTNYSTPATITRTASADTYTTAVTYTLLNENCVATSNVNTTLTINGNSKSNTKSHSRTIPYGTRYTVTALQQSGNYTASTTSYTYTASTPTRNVSFTYSILTERCTVTSNVATTITINGSSKNNVTSYSVDVPYGTTYTVSVSSRVSSGSGYWQTSTTSYTYTANSTSRSASFTYVFDCSNGHSYVDLGLPSGTKWATSNAGNTSWWNASGYTTEWGGCWAVPTQAQYNELINNTSYSFTDWTSCTFTAPNGNSVTFPINFSYQYGRGTYWTSSREPYYFYYFYFDNHSCRTDYTSYSDNSNGVRLVWK